MRIKIPGYDWAEGEVVAGRDILVGDRIVGIKFSDWKPWGVTGEGEIVLWIKDLPFGKRGGSGNIGILDGYDWLVKNRGPVVATSTVSAAWNGKCGKCGRGTYQGFTTFEHEGGPCHG